jgi:hypothetical protein
MRRIDPVGRDQALGELDYVYETSVLFRPVLALKYRIEWS